MRYTLFGESHGVAVGVLVTHLPAGLPLDEEALRAALARRAGGNSPLATARKEPDVLRFLSGVYEGKTTGAPLCALMENKDVRSEDYAQLGRTPRPSHADYPAFVKSGGCNDPRGGGHRSGRLTAPLVAAGVLAQTLLGAQGITLGGHILQIGSVWDDPFENPTVEELEELENKPFPTRSDAAGEAMAREILAAKAEGDSVGGSVECAVLGLPAGLGEPDFPGNVKSVVARQLFAVPGVFGVSFGAGFDFAALRGSTANDPLYAEGKTIKTRSNHSGGINGGMTNGMPLLCRVALRPTPSIARAQETVNLETLEPVTLALQGRHDPCIAVRALPALLAALALALSEFFENEEQSNEL